MDIVTNCIKIASNPKLKMSPDGDFFQAWAESLKFVHSLTKRETEIFAAVLKKHYEMVKKGLEVDDGQLFEKRQRADYCKHLKMTARHFNTTLCKFRKVGVVTGELGHERILPKLVPVLTKDGAMLVINFSFKNEHQLIKLGPQANKPRA